MATHSVDGDGPPTATTGRDSEQHVAVALRSYASPLPLGFFSLAVGMALLAALGLGWLSTPEDVRTSGLVVAAFVVPLELVAAIVAMLARDTAVATAQGLFTTSWLALGLAGLLDPTARPSRTIGVPRRVRPDVGAVDRHGRPGQGRAGRRVVGLPARTRVVTRVPAPGVREQL